METKVRESDRIIIGIDPGTNIMGYGILGIKAKKPFVEQYCPDEMAIEAPFFGKNVQSMLKLGRAQGVAMAAALSKEVPITEYEPRKIKQAITGSGAASKEQVKEMLRRILDISSESLETRLDATDALGAALCHFYESSRPSVPKGASSWKEFIAKNPDRVK